MAAPTGTIVLTTATASINSVALSAYVKSLTLTLTPDALEDTAMGATFHTKKPGLIVFKAVVEFFQRFDSALVNETIYPLIGIGVAPFPAIFVGVSGSGSNNTFTLANCIVDGPWEPIKGSVGQLVLPVLTLGAGSGFTCTKS